MTSDNVTVLDVDTSSQVPISNNDSSCASSDANSTFVDNCDKLMRKAYGVTLIQSGSCSNTPWHQR